VYPFLNIPTEPLLADPKKRTFTVSLPYDDAFRLCLRSLDPFPVVDEPAADPAKGTIFAELEGTRFSFNLRRSASRKTAVVISATEPFLGSDQSEGLPVREVIRILDRVQEFCEENQRTENAYWKGEAI
jgi:hypothetical protein